MSEAESRIRFPEELPVSRMRDEISAAIEKHQVLIVAGETGSGKTTQLPKIALALGRERIAHTQPRRIAARTIAERIADELGSELGDLVGYQVRFTDRVSERTRIRLMTDGILLNAIHRDRDLRAYDTIIIDEAHERSLNIDFLLGYLRTLLPRRPDLKVIITSATIDPESFARHFAGPDGEPAPIIEVSGRTYPVEIRYRPLVEQQEIPDPKGGAPRTRSIERDLFDAIGDAVAELSREDPGDVLVFLSGEAEIRDAADALRGRLASSARTRPAEILPLYGRLSAAEQHRVFERATLRQARGPAARRIVLATNVAETSLTVPGIRYVVDAGTARISRYSSRSKVQRLPIEAISQASANQRSGRSGRTSPGIAIRLYSEEDFGSRPAYTEPEILRTGLASVILQMLSLGLGDIAAFPFLTPPDQRGIADGLGLLAELGAVESRSPRQGQGARRHRITKVGRELTRLPIEPRFARMIVESRRHGATAEVIAIVAGLTVQDVRERPAEQRARADELHARFADPLGDAMTLLNLWNHLQEQQADLSSSAFRRLCRAEFLNFLRVREWMDLVRQLNRSAKASPSGDSGAGSGSAEAIHRSMLAGLLSHIGVRDDRQDRRAAPGGRGAGGASRRKPAQEYLGSRGTRFALHPGSVLAKRPPEVVMSVELVETSRLFARGNAAIEPEWAEELAGPLAKRQLSEPRWEKSQGAAVAYERVTLYGVPIVERRRVQLARFDPAHARELFIRHALVGVENDTDDGGRGGSGWDAPGGPLYAFDRANRQLRRELEQLEERTRRRGLVGDDDAVFDFYDERIPHEVASVRDFEGWWKKEHREQPKLLHLRREDLLDDDADAAADGAADRAFPREWRHGDQTLRLRYRFDPTAEDDGVTVAVPLPLLPRIEGGEFEKLVPGLREELVAALIRTLPKAIRKHVVPAADWARTLLGALGPRLDDPAETRTLTELLAAEIRRRTSAPITSESFDAARLPAHLTPTFRVIDERGRAIGTGKDLAELQAAHRDRATRGVARVSTAARPKNDLERSGLRAWDFGDLPEHLDSSFAGGRGGGGVVRAYPALVDRRDSVDLVLVADESEQRRLSRRGVRRLLVLSSPSPASYVRDHLSNQEKLLLGGGPHRTLDEAIADVSAAVADRVLRRHRPDGLVRRQQDFETIANEYARALIDEIYRGIALTARVLDEARLARKAIEGTKSLQVLGQVADAKAQLDGLVYPAGGAGEGFVSRTGLDRLERVPVYLEGIRQRMAGLAAQPGRDRAWQNESDRALALFAEAGGSIPLPPDAPERLVRARWLIEELRISLFAQQLRTAEPASLARLQKTLAE
ncbi:ATP-dependent RNA helicase HrpA [Leucobacter weissii]|uniref:ATP-dependent RNA helicase HrpA n=1 Tax=Leucobacter weissii TaxID=1983706 RepID=A0A939S7B6_9MICO|nr:ATP-dependent RNA helicase HrpA [Leucobacter weissii]MBO1900821.1 ATP-dependent RNA helicase HrpA [Leucobacter weissii]